MATHPMVLLVEPDPTLRGLIRSELKDEGCVVVDRATGDEALAFAKIFPGPIDLAVTDLPRPEHNARFAHALRALPTGSEAAVSCLPSLFDRDDLIDTVREALPASVRTRTLETQPEQGDRAVFWGARQHEAPSQSHLSPAAGF